jgi:hypothetical protein
VVQFKKILEIAPVLIQLHYQYVDKPFRPRVPHRFPAGSSEAKAVTRGFIALLSVGWRG